MQEAISRKEKERRFTIAVKKAKDLGAKVHVLASQHPTGLLLVHTVAEIEELDGGKHIEVTTDDGRKHVLSADDPVLVVF